MDIREFFALATGDISGPIIVGRVSHSVQKALDAATRVVLLSRSTMEKQMARHGELTLSGCYDYLPSVLAHGEAFRMHDRRVSLVWGMRHRRVRGIRITRLNAVIKATSNREELYAISFYPIRARDWKNTRRKHNPIP